MRVPIVCLFAPLPAVVLPCLTVIVTYIVLAINYVEHICLFVSADCSGFIFSLMEYLSIVLLHF